MITGASFDVFKIKIRCRICLDIEERVLGGELTSSLLGVQKFAFCFVARVDGDFEVAGLLLID